MPPTGGSAAIAQEGSKLFVTPLSARARAANAVAAASRGEGGGSSSNNGGSLENGDDDDDDDEEEEEEGGASQGANGGAARGGSVGRASDGPSRGRQPVFMTPLGAPRHVDALWREEGASLRRLYPHLSAGAFFQQVVAVPPSRFRPPAVMGDQIFEHPQNVWLGKIIQSNEQLRELYAAAGPSNSPNSPSDGPDGEATGEPNGAAAKEPLNMDRVLRTWGELSRAVCCLVDANAGDGGGGGAAAGGEVPLPPPSPPPDPQEAVSRA